MIYFDAKLENFVTPEELKERLGINPGGHVQKVIDAAVIREFKGRYSAVRAFHMSGKTELESAMVFRREGVPMGLPGLDEWHIQQTDREAVAAARKALAE